MPLKPMLAKDANLDKLRFPLIAQPKLDGIRVHVQDGVAYTRTLKRVPNGEIQAALGNPIFNGLDGEVIIGSPTAEDCYRQTSSFVMSGSKRGAEWTFYVFDLISPIPSNASYEARRASLAQREPSWPTNMALVAEARVDTVERLEAMETHMVESGYEGVILRTLDAPYKHGRSTPTGPLLKLKRFVDFEVVVLDTYEEQHNANQGFTNELGRTARSTAKDGKVGKGSLGGLVVSPVDDSVADPNCTFRVGTGFTAAERAQLWADRDSLPGKLWKVKSFPIGVKDKPRHPVSLGERFEGDR